MRRQACEQMDVTSNATLSPSGGGWICDTINFPNQGATVEALNIASATKAHVDTISVASRGACGPLSPSCNVEARRATRLPRPNILQVQHCIMGGGPQISCRSASFSGPRPLFVCSALAVFRASTVHHGESLVLSKSKSVGHPSCYPLKQGIHPAN